ncbi:exported hypothetical protein [Frankia sp. AgKG'84/4]
MSNSTPSKRPSPASASCQRPVTISTPRRPSARAQCRPAAAVSGLASTMTWRPGPRSWTSPADSPSPKPISSTLPPGTVTASASARISGSSQVCITSWPETSSVPSTIVGAAWSIAVSMRGRAAPGTIVDAAASSAPRSATNSSRARSSRNWRGSSDIEASGDDPAGVSVTSKLALRRNTRPPTTSPALRHTIVTLVTDDWKTREPNAEGQAGAAGPVPPIISGRACHRCDKGGARYPYHLLV